ncbi:hypothetical protein ACHWQZ_G001587 [Mnemiopsis leidyi]
MTSSNSTRVRAPNQSAPPDSPIYDGNSLKPHGRVVLDSCGEPGKAPFIHRRNFFQLSTLNTRTLNPLSRKHELASSAFLHHNDIVCIQEHRQFHKESLKIETVNSYDLITASSTKNTVNASVGGVGFLLSPRARKCLLSVDKISPRIIVIHISGNPKLSVISCYSPTNCSSETEKDNFYRSLSSTINKVPPHNMLAVCGDFNAKLDNMSRFSHHQETNDNGERLLDLCDEHKLVITNTRFQKGLSKLWTYEDPKKQRHQIDFILWRKKWINSVKNCQAYNSMQTVGSDHRIVSCFVQVSYRVNKIPAKDPLRSVDWQELNNNPLLRHHYAVEVRNRYDSLLDNADLEADYECLMESIASSALEVLPKKKKRRKENPYKDPNIDHHRHVLQQSALAHRTAPSFSTKEKLEEAKKQLDEAYTTATKQFVEKQTSFLEKSNPEHRHHSSWKIIRDLTSSNAVPFSKIPGGTTEERLNIWYEHFKSLLGSSSCSPDLSSPFFNMHVSKTLPISCEPFDLLELEQVLNSLNSSKSPGLDNIPPTVWKLKPFRRDLLGFCNEALVNGRVPDAWTTASIIPIPKKGDLSKPGNYRGISLAPVAAKIFNKLLLNRIYPHVDPLLRPNQNGFRRGRSTLPQILALRRIIEECRIGKKSAAIVFVDFSKAFDSINRDALFHILSLYGIPAPIIKAIRLLYDSAKSRVQTSDGLTEFFETLIGVLQGDTLAPFLFIIVLDYILRNCMSPDYGLTITPRQSRRIPAVTVTDLDFADDLALLSNTIQEAQSLLNNLEVAAEKVGLSMNSSKTEFMTINIDSDKASIKSKGGHSLEHVDDFKYLGSYIADSKQDFNTRKGMAWTACMKLQKVWTSGISEHLKVKFFKACVEPVLLYGSETWTLNKQFEKRLNGCYTRLLMKARNLHWKDHPTLKRIYGDLPSIATVLAQRRARFAGHCMRAHDQIISSVLPWRLPQTGRGRRPLTFLDTVARDAGVEIGDLRGVMLDRTVWRNIVEQFSIEDRPK